MIHRFRYLMFDWKTIYRNVFSYSKEDATMTSISGYLPLYTLKANASSKIENKLYVYAKPNKDMITIYRTSFDEAYSHICGTYPSLFGYRTSSKTYNVETYFIVGCGCIFTKDCRPLYLVVSKLPLEEDARNGNKDEIFVASEFMYSGIYERFYKKINTLLIQKALEEGVKVHIMPIKDIENTIYPVSTLTNFNSFDTLNSFQRYMKRDILNLIFEPNPVLILKDDLKDINLTKESINKAITTSML